jgi:hypothetical protein
MGGGEQPHGHSPIVEDIRIHQQDRHAATQHVATMPERNDTAVAKRWIFDQHYAPTALVPRHLIAQIRCAIADRDCDLVYAARVENSEVSRQQALAAEAQKGFRRRLRTHSPAATSGEDQSATDAMVRLHANRRSKYRMRADTNSTL